MSTSAPESPVAEGDLKGLPTEELKKRRTSGRREVTSYCNKIVSIVSDPRSSRTVIKGFLKRAEAAYNLSWVANNLLLEDCTDEACATEELDKQLGYLQKYEEVVEVVREYLESRADEAESVVSRTSQYRSLSQRPASEIVQQQDGPSPGSQPPLDLIQDQPESQQLDAYARPQVTFAIAAATGNPPVRATIPSPRMEPPSSHVADQPRDSGLMGPFLEDVARSQLRALEQSDLARAPDAWIDDYVAGREPEEPRCHEAGYKSSVRADLEIYDGSPLDWFQWIDLFRNLVHDTGMSSGEKLAILRRHLRGHCLDIVYGLGGGDIAYKEALLRLKERCGRRDVLRAAHIQAIDGLVPGSQPAQFQRYAEKVRTHLFDLARLGEAHNLDIVERVLSHLKLPDRLAYNEKKVAGSVPHSLTGFGQWLCNRATAYTNAFDVAAEYTASRKEPPGPTGQRETKKFGRSHTAQSNNDSGPTKSQQLCSYCQGPHQLPECNMFRNTSVVDRQRHCAQSKLCFSCLREGHPLRFCKRSKVCGVNGCQRKHNVLLHEDAVAVNSTSVNAASASSAKVALGLLKVAVIDRAGNRIVATAFLDEGSDCTLVREEFLRKLSVSGSPQPLRLHGVAGACKEVVSQRVRLQIESLSGGKRFFIEASSVPTICNPAPVVAWPRIQSQWNHLKNLPLAEVGGKVDLLLGLDHADLLVAEEVRTGLPGEPVAIKMSLGWLARGVIGRPLEVKGQGVRVNLLSCAPTGGEDLTWEFRRFCQSEAIGTEALVEPKLAPDDEQALKILEEGSRYLDPGYEVPLPWKAGEPKLTDNRMLAEVRLKSLQRRLNSDPAFAADYFKSMKKYVEEGYAHEVTEREELATTQQYFLPHHGVYKGSERTGKLRVVFDAAAQFQGKCLNDALLAGPPLQNELAGVLIRFRTGAFAVAADINAMFSRIRMGPQDAAFHRYLWFDDSGQPKTFQMDRVSFGDKSSPFIAIYVTRRVARDFGNSYPEAVKAIEQNLYMDDYLDSGSTEQEIAQRSSAVKNILAKADFHLGKWRSNSAWVLEKVSDTSTSPPAEESLPLFSGELSTKVLGIGWKPAKDVLYITPSVVSKPVFTRRGLLRETARIFDPLGFLAPLTVKAKIRLRQLGLHGLPWDEEVTGDAHEWWKLWLKQVRNLRVEVPRCLLQEERLKTTQLHTFCDASLDACAAAVYIRTVDEDNVVQVKLLMAKTRLSPMKSVTIAKLELQAALMGARLAAYVQQHLNRPVQGRWFWTDSSCVRGWVRSPAANYKQYVSCRIGEIQTLTEPSDWRHVPGRANISDVATRSDLKQDHEVIPGAWFDGPSFLQQSSEHWPKDLPSEIRSEELRAPEAHLFQATSGPSPEWNSLDAVETAGFTRLEGKLLDLLLLCQKECFPKEVAALKNGLEIPKCSPLLPLSPIMGADGLIRVGGRLQHAVLPYDAKHPVILPKEHPLSRKIAAHFHQSLHHSGTDLVLSHLRQHYWILRGRELVKGTRRSCQQCQRESAKPASQRMADLPPERLGVGSPPFHFTSVDFFGPFQVVYGRNNSVKRYGALFACMTTRAVYLDLCRSLSSDDFLLVLRRFVSLYGKPKLMYSDNGTNFVGAERELRTLAESVKSELSVETFLKQNGLEWKFQPPNAPHFGGVHESLVRSTKRALYRTWALTKPTGITEDVLRTLLFEVAGLLNSRPLTYVSSDSNDLRPLTPNDLLNRPSTATAPRGDFSDPAPRERFKETQRLTQLFWDIWRRLYLPSLTARSKWKRTEKNLQVGDVVLVAEPNQPRGRWELAKVVDVYPGPDNRVRVVRVKTETGSYVRPVHRLALLESCSSRVPALGGEDVRAS